MVAITPTAADIMSMEWSFNVRDVIGRKPSKVGDVFKARAFGMVAKFCVTRMHPTFFMAVLAIA